MLKKLNHLIVAAGLIASTIQPASANLAAVGPVNPQNGFPLWYQDTNGVAISLGLDPALNVFDPPIAGNAFSQQIGFGNEGFYWIAESSLSLPSGLALLRLAHEYAFATPAPADGGQVVFQRIRIRADVDTIGTYVVTHPYGVATFNVTAIIPGPEINSTVDGPLGTPNEVVPFAVSLNGPGVVDPCTTGPCTIGPFLRAVTPAPPAGFVGSGIVATSTVTGSPNGTNFFRIQGPVGANLDGLGGNVVETDQFAVSGKIMGMAVTPVPPADMGKVIIGSSSLPKTMTITNLTTTALTLPAAFTPTGPNAADFVITAPAAGVSCLGAPLAANGTCNFDVTFTPSAAGGAARNATLTIAATPAGASPDAIVALNGTAQQAVTVIQGTNGTITATNPAATIDPISGLVGVNLATDQVFTMTPAAGFVLLDAKVDNISVRAQVVNNTFTLTNVIAPHTLTASFIRRGDLTGDGVVTTADANRAMEIVTGLGAAPTAEEIASLDVAPMVNSQPSSDGTLDIGDVIMILRRANNLGPAW